MRKAFTIVELLVVVAIITILAAIVMPVLTRARAKGRFATCVSNLKQIGAALQAYQTDYDENFPVDSDRGPGSFWCERIQPYVRNMDIGICPEKGLLPRTPPGGDHPYTWNYAMSCVMCRIDMFGANTLTDLARIHVQYDVARMFMVGEGLNDTVPPSWIAPAWWPYTSYHEFWHNERSNVLFVDGHVKSLGREARFSWYPGLLQ